MSLHRQRTQKYLQKFDFESLFIEELGWDRVDRVRLPFEIEDEFFEVVSIAQKRGFIVYQCNTPEIPARPIRVSVSRQLMDYSKSHLLIFVDEQKTQQEWLWLKPEPGKSAKVRSHSHKVSQNPELLLQKLEALVVDFKEEESLTHVDVAQKVKQGFDVERVTKQFFQDFEGLHQQFCLEIEGINNEADRRWYASVLLNRLMFIYFLQRRYFLDNGDALYLQNKLRICQQEGRSFYEFLKDLFFVGFAEPESYRDPVIQQRLGKICYLNGGLFLRHTIEQSYPQIQIHDRAFTQVFDLFSRYSWHLDDRPDKDPLEINPDVLGYIFEKYINQKEFGAYYTRPEITEYLCDRTINKLILDKVAVPGVETMTELLVRLEGPLCDRLLNEILPNLSLLDPACGSGAFLVAAMKTLIAVYSAVVAQARQCGEAGVRAWLAEAGRHSSIDYYIKKRIITDNLYGVDIMEEATEIAKLRLFLALVASAKTVEDLEPLPNVDFNIMAGNSLIGLIRVDEEAFNQLLPQSKAKSQTKGTKIDPVQVNLLGPTLVQGSLLGLEAVSQYRRILEEKNSSIEAYKRHAFLPIDASSDLDQSDRLQQLKTHIAQVNADSQGKLNQILFTEFLQLGIRYEEAQVTGKAKKRDLTIADVEALEPFHWGYHFDRVFARGGFDAIIANPPWETFKPNAKEFFARYSDQVTKKKMSIKEFEAEKKRLLQDPEIAAAWRAYQGQFPHVSAYFRSADDYANQISVVNGKKAGTDINLYKLFLERCYHLLRKAGECGIVIPSGIYTDLGTKQLREMLFSQTEVTGLFCFENRKMIFEGVDCRFKFVILNFEKGGSTQSFPVRFMRHDVAELVDFPASDDIVLNVPLIRKLSPDSLSVMEFKQEIDLEIAEKMLKFPLLGETLAETWNLKLNREFDMTNDSHLFKTEPAPGRLPLYEGKMIHQFTHQFEPTALRYWVNEQEARQAVLGKIEDSGQKLDYQDYRLGFRKIGRNTDIRTLISTVISPNFCSENFQVALSFDESKKRYVNYDEMLFLCALLNSFSVDYLIRQKVSANVNFFYVYQLPVPRLQSGDRWFDAIVTRAAKLICTAPEFDDLAQTVGLGSHKNGITNPVQRAQLRAELDGLIAHLYSLTEPEFAHILSTFPIVPDPIKQAALTAYRDVEQGLLP